MINFDYCRLSKAHHYTLKYELTAGTLFHHCTYINEEFVRGSYQLLLSGNDPSYFISTLTFEKGDQVPDVTDIVDYLCNTAFETEKELKSALKKKYGFF